MRTSVRRKFYALLTGACLGMIGVYVLLLYDDQQLLIRYNGPNSERLGLKKEETQVHNVDDVSFPQIDTGPINCMALFNGDERTLIEAEIHQNHTKHVKETSTWTLVRNCKNLIKERRYITEPLSREEAEYPIAYSIMIFSQADQFEHLLRSIYHPQNIYCIHIDAKAHPLFKTSVKELVSCFPNVFISSRSIRVKWGRWSVVEAELMCMEDLLGIPGWKYHLNLAGSEFPLKTNWELVNILKTFNGSNLVDASMYFPKQRTASNKRRGFKGDPPFGITLRKGGFLVAVTREFVDFVINSNISKVFQQWLVNTNVPDETFFSSLNSNPHLQVPGSYTGGFLREMPKIYYPNLSRYVQWWDVGCAGEYIHKVCIFGLGDLQNLYNQPQLFLNKLDLKAQPLVYSCMEQLHFNRTRQQYLGHKNFNKTLYSQYEFTWNHL